MNQVIEAVIAREYSDLQGTRIAATIPITESVLNTAANSKLGTQRGPVRAVDIQIGNQNYLEIGLKTAAGPFTKWFRPEVIIERQSVPPTIVLTFASAGYAGALRIVDLLAKEFLPGGIVIRGRQIVVDLAAILANTEYRSIARHIRSLDIETTKGKLVLHLELEIK
jgi:hypothetical protein